MSPLSRAAPAVLLNAAIFRTVRSAFPASAPAATFVNPNPTRAKFLGDGGGFLFFSTSGVGVASAAAATAAATEKTTGTRLKSASSNEAEADMDESIALLNSVYGPVDGPSFPLPMPVDEAGPCGGAEGQRRYLWTDAFGVLAYVSLAEECERRRRRRGGQNEGRGNDEDGGDENDENEKWSAEASKYRRAASALIDVVHKCLGRPRSDRPEHAMRLSSSTCSTPSGYVGLRIGKVDSRRVTDYGMRYDGQYWHYVDKWLLALARAGRIDEGIRIAKAVFPYFFDAGTDGKGSDGGIRWKLNVDSSYPSELQRSYASDDTLVALIAFSILESARKKSGGDRDGKTPGLEEEIDMLQNSLRGYRPRVTDDPLGWGLEATYDQFLEGRPRQRSLARLSSRALHPSHLSLPFRLYGAMIGARIAGDAVADPQWVDKLVKLSIDHENGEAQSSYEEHSSINRVMLAMCLLCPGALGRRPDDPLIALE